MSVTLKSYKRPVWQWFGGCNAFRAFWDYRRGVTLIPCRWNPHLLIPSIYILPIHSPQHTCTCTIPTRGWAWETLLHDKPHTKLSPSGRCNSTGHSMQPELINCVDWIWSPWLVYTALRAETESLTGLHLVRYLEYKVGHAVLIAVAIPEDGFAFLHSRINRVCCSYYYYPTIQLLLQVNFFYFYTKTFPTCWRTRKENQLPCVPQVDTNIMGCWSCTKMAKACTLL